MVKEIPWGDLHHVADDRPEPWEVVATQEEAAGWHETLLGPLPPRVLVGFTPTWGVEVTRYDPAKLICPGCSDRRLRPGQGCVICGATSANATQWPMQYTPKPERGKTGLKKKVKKK